MRNTFFLFRITLLFALTACFAKTKAQTITSYVVYPYCLVDSMFVVTAGSTLGDSVETFYGDGTSDFNPILYTGSTSYSNFYAHTYSAPGMYSLKFILFSSGVAVDSISHISQRVSCNDIQCFLYNDLNGNCIFDAGDYSLYNPATVEIDSAGIPIDTITSTGGIHTNVLGPTGTIYSFKVISIPFGFNVSCSGSGIVYDTIGVTVNEPSIGFACNPLAPAFDLAVSANFSAGLTGAGSHIFIANSSCSSAPVSATLTIEHSPKYIFSTFWTGGGGTYPYTISGNSVTFNIGNVSVDSPVHFVPVFDQVGTLTLGDTVNTKFRLTPVIGDVDTINNIIITSDTIRVSHDPNYKSVMPTGDILPGTMLKYSISFENTGNDTAFNIHILDTLSDNLDIHTLKVISTSAAMNLILLKSGIHNIIKFDFPNINLLDTSHHHYCNGMVTYTIQAKTGLTPGTKIDNEAGIYFDVNPVVMTNNVENIIGSPTGITPISNTSSIYVYPNPATDILAVTGMQQSTDYRIFSITGLSIQQGIFTQSNNTLSMKGFAPGIYILEMTGNDGERNIVRVIKQ